MKKFFLFFLLLHSFAISYAQYILSSNLLTEAEKEVTEKTKDDAYLAPSSKFVGKKLYVLDNKKEFYYIFNQNGTGNCVMSSDITRFGSHPVKASLTVPFRWKRSGLDVTYSLLWGSSTLCPTQSSLAPYSLRRQDEIKKDLCSMKKKIDLNSH